MGVEHLAPPVSQSAELVFDGNEHSRGALSGTNIPWGRDG